MNEAARVWIRRFAASGVSVAAIVLLTATAKSDDRIQLIPHLQNGQTLQYQSHGRLNRYVKTKSKVATMFEPKPVREDFSTTLQLSIQDFHTMDHRPMLAAQTQVVPEEQPSGTDAAALAPLKVDFVIGGDGAVSHADGLDNLSSEQLLAWQFWIAQFAFAWTMPASGVKPGEKWKSTEVEKAPSPIANLIWERETTYVQNEVCPTLPSESCAVFLTNATLKQRSNPQDATPEDYKLHALKTFGTAKGTNQVVLYISLKTGLLLRATEDVQQSLDATIVKVDGTNQVQYLVDVTSHFETVFVPDTDSHSPSR
ncbi:MAG: hypothetical protein WB556_21995 [Candidatus Acidiferrum sp.]